MPRVARGPLEPKVGKGRRKALAGELRAHLRRAPMDMREMAAALSVTPEVVVIALRELRGRRRGRLLSTVRLGHVCWWWEDPPDTGSSKKEDSKKGKKKDGAEPGAAKQRKAKKKG